MMRWLCALLWNVLRVVTLGKCRTADEKAVSAALLYLRGTAFWTVVAPASIHEVKNIDGLSTPSPAIYSLRDNTSRLLERATSNSGFLFDRRLDGLYERP